MQVVDDGSIGYTVLYRSYNLPWMLYCTSWMNNSSQHLKVGYSRWHANSCVISIMSRGICLKSMIQIVFKFCQQKDLFQVQMMLCHQQYSSRIDYPSKWHFKDQIRCQDVTKNGPHLGRQNFFAFKNMLQTLGPHSNDDFVLNVISMYLPNNFWDILSWENAVHHTPPQDEDSWLMTNQPTSFDVPP